MGKLISETQSAFLSDRNILDGVVTLNELIEDARKTRKCRLFFKVDFAKAFDSIDWSYLLGMMKQMNFPDLWISWIKECVTTATANVLVNGSPSGEFGLERGIRQGDPLSPYLFLIAAEGLHLLTKRAIQEGLISLVFVGRDKIEVSHLQYADDTIFSVEGSKENAMAIKWLLKNFELISGLSVNFNKSCLYGVNVVDSHLMEWAEELGCKVSTLPIPYLGIKVGGRLNGVEGWHDLIERVKGRLRGWDPKSLSIGGRATLVKSVLNAIPLYNMSFLPMPKKVADQLRSLQCSFLWGGSEGSRKLAWVSWDDICKPKKEGGLGIRNLSFFNKALLCKWVWRFLGEEEKLWARVIRSRHGIPFWSLCRVNSGRGGTRISGWWKKILDIVEGQDGQWFWNNLGQKLGDGSRISFWEGLWPGDKPLKEIFPRLFRLSLNKEGSVQDMGHWHDGTWHWDLGWRRMILEREIPAINELKDFLKNFNVTEGARDRWMWKGSAGGSFSVKRAYAEISKGRCDNNPPPHSQMIGTNSLIWNSYAPFKAQILSWRIIRDRVPTKENLNKRRIINDEDLICCCCNQEIESTSHLFLHCPEVDRLWNKLIEWIGAVWAGPNSLFNHLPSFSLLLGTGKVNRNLSGLWCCVVWVIWKWRNSSIFESKAWDFRRIEEEIKCRFWSWCVVRGAAEANLSFLDWTKNSLASTWISS